MPTASSPNYPLTTPQKQLILTTLETTTTDLNNALDLLRKTCAETHSLTPATCPEHTTALRTLLQNYYTNPPPGSWLTYRRQIYLLHLTTLFTARNPSVPMSTIANRIYHEQRDHLHDALCTPRPDDNDQVKSYKSTASSMFEDLSVPADEVLDFVRNSEEEMRALRSDHERALQARWDECHSFEERWAFYREIATTHVDGESMADRRLREKWRGMFDDAELEERRSRGMRKRDYGEIYAVMRKDVEKAREGERTLRGRLQELDMARAALGRAKMGRAARVGEKERERVRAWREENGRPRCVRCGLEVVPKESSSGTLPPRCGVCEDEVKEGRRKRGSGWFCGEECVVLGAREHVLSQHGNVVREEVEMLERLKGEGDDGKGEKHPDSA